MALLEGPGEAEVGASEGGRNGAKSRVEQRCFGLISLMKWAMQDLLPLVRKHGSSRQGEGGLLALLWRLMLMATDESSSRRSA